MRTGLGSRGVFEGSGTNPSHRITLLEREGWIRLECSSIAAHIYKELLAHFQDITGHYSIAQHSKHNRQYDECLVRTF